MEIVNGHAMNSPLLQLCAKMMMSGDHPPLFKLELMEKDARLATELHTQVGSPGVVTSAVQQAYAAAMDEGFSASNWTAVHESMKTSKLPTNQNSAGKTVGQVAGQKVAGGEGGDGDAPTAATSAKTVPPQVPDTNTERAGSKPKLHYFNGRGRANPARSVSLTHHGRQKDISPRHTHTAPLKP